MQAFNQICFVCGVQTPSLDLPDSPPLTSHALFLEQPTFGGGGHSYLSCVVYMGFNAWRKAQHLIIVSILYKIHNRSNMYLVCIYCPQDSEIEFHNCFPVIIMASSSSLLYKLPQQQDFVSTVSKEEVISQDAEQVVARY